MNDFWIWLDYKCPKPIKWLIYAAFTVLALCIFIGFFWIMISIYVLFGEIIPKELEPLGIWGAIIEVVIVCPLFLVSVYGVIYLFIKIFHLK